MRRLVMTRLVRVDALPNGEGARVEIDTSEGPLELRFTYEVAERLSAALHRTRKTRIPRSEVAALVHFLEEACRRFDDAADPPK